MAKNAKQKARQKLRNDPYYNGGPNGLPDYVEEYPEMSNPLLGQVGTPVDLSWMNEPGGGFDSGDGGGGGGGTEIAFPDLGLLADSPDWQALMAELDKGAALASADKGRGVGNAYALRDRLLGELTPQYEEQREGISGSHEARGVGQSGALETALARSRGNEASRRTAIGQDASFRVGEYEAALARQLADIDSRRAASRLDFISRGYKA